MNLKNSPIIKWLDRQKPSEEVVKDLEFRLTKAGNPYTTEHVLESFFNTVDARIKNPKDILPNNFEKIGNLYWALFLKRRQGLETHAKYLIKLNQRLLPKSWSDHWISNVRLYDLFSEYLDDAFKQDAVSLGETWLTDTFIEKGKRPNTKLLAVWVHEYRDSYRQQTAYTIKLSEKDDEVPGHLRNHLLILDKQSGQKCDTLFLADLATRVMEKRGTSLPTLDKCVTVCEGNLLPFAEPFFPRIRSHIYRLDEKYVTRISSHPRGRSKALEYARESYKKDELLSYAYILWIKDKKDSSRPGENSLSTTLAKELLATFEYLVKNEKYADASEVYLACLNARRRTPISTFRDPFYELDIFDEKLAEISEHVKDKDTVFKNVISELDYQNPDLIAQARYHLHQPPIAVPEEKRLQSVESFLKSGPARMNYAKYGEVRAYTELIQFSHSDWLQDMIRRRMPHFVLESRSHSSYENFTWAQVSFFQLAKAAGLRFTKEAYEGFVRRVDEFYSIGVPTSTWKRRIGWFDEVVFANPLLRFSQPLHDMQECMPDMKERFPSVYAMAEKTIMNIQEAQKRQTLEEAFT